MPNFLRIEFRLVDELSVDLPFAADRFQALETGALGAPDQFMFPVTASVERSLHAESPDQKR